MVKRIIKHGFLSFAIVSVIALLIIGAITFVKWDEKFLYNHLGFIVRLGLLSSIITMSISFSLERLNRYKVPNIKSPTKRSKGIKIY